MVPIVEGYGDVEAVPALLTRVMEHVGGASFLISLPAIRVPKARLLRPLELQRAVELAKRRLASVPNPMARRLVLILIDADEHRACELAPRLLADAGAASPDFDLSCVLAVSEFETWFVASAESLSAYIDLTAGTPPSDDPEAARHGKRWIEQRFRGPKYSETLDQKRMAAEMDLGLCRRRSRSFDKLCREIEARARPR